VLNEEPSVAVPVQHHSISDEDMSLPEEERITYLNSAEELSCSQTNNEGCVTQTPGPLPVRPTTMPGAVWVNGPNFNSADRNNDDRSISNDEPEPYLAVGTLVIDPPIVHAKPLVPFFVKYRRWLSGVLIVGVVVIVSFLAVRVPKNKKNAERTTTLKKIALEVSNQTSINGLGFSQKQALDWILGANNNRFDPLHDKEKIMQRYQLANLYYSTTGENWTKSGNFMSDDDECNWIQESVICSADQRITNITLGEVYFLMNKNNGCAYLLF